MVKDTCKWFFLVIIGLFLSNAYAQTPLQNPINYKIIKLLGAQEYQTNQKFIQRLFSNQNYFLDDEGQPNLYKISQTLKQNGLLKLTFKEPRELEVTFIIEENPTTFTSVLYDILSEMGYYYFLLKESLLDDKKFKFILSMNTEYAIDPTLLQEKLSHYGYEVQNIERDSVYQWSYEVANSSFAYPKATPLILNQNNQKANLKGEYWYQIQEGTHLAVKSINGILWYPKLIFFDKNLNILEIINEQKALRSIQKEIPTEAIFVKITDAYLPITIKNGLDVMLK